MPKLCRTDTHLHGFFILTIFIIRRHDLTAYNIPTYFFALNTFFLAHPPAFWFFLSPNYRELLRPLSLPDTFAQDMTNPQPCKRQQMQLQSMPCCIWCDCCILNETFNSSSVSNWNVSNFLRSLRPGKSDCFWFSLRRFQQYRYSIIELELYCRYFIIWCIWKTSSKPDYGRFIIVHTFWVFFIW